MSNGLLINAEQGGLPLSILKIANQIFKTLVTCMASSTASTKNLCFQQLTTSTAEFKKWIFKIDGPWGLRPGAQFSERVSAQT